VPLIVERRVAGGFYLVWWTARRVFDEAEVALAETVGQQVGQFLENARLYEQLEQSHRRSAQTERLRALGEMAAGVAHDFNNLLAVIMGRAELLRQKTDAPDVRRSLDIIATAAEDGARTVRRIQEFTRRSPPRPLHAVDLAAVVRDVLQMTQASWKDQAQARGIQYEAVSELEPVPQVMGDASDLREALTNLVFNALDAMPQGGRLTVRLTADRERVRCDVIDTGVGMARDVRERVFEPFFSTKKSDGTGLGLSVVYSIVTRSGGEVAVESAPGLGSTFTFWLPVMAAHSAPTSMEPAASAPPRAARILVVDDEPHILEAIAEVLKLDGHTVVACPDGGAALRSLQSERFDLVLTDLGMPGIGGWDVIQAVKERWLETPVGLITGWSDSLDPVEVKRRGVDFVVPKPFRMRDIRDAIGRWVT